MSFVYELEKLEIGRMAVTGGGTNRRMAKVAYRFRSGDETIMPDVVITVYVDATVNADDQVLAKAEEVLHRATRGLAEARRAEVGPID